MPELPELEVVKEVLQRRVVGRSIDAVRVDPKGGAIVIRDLTHRGFEKVLIGSSIVDVTRRGKFLLFSILPSSSFSIPNSPGVCNLPRRMKNDYPKPTSSSNYPAAMNSAMSIKRRWAKCT